MEFAIDAALAQAPCDQLGHLRPKIQDENAIGCQGGGERDSHVNSLQALNGGVLAHGRVRRQSCQRCEVAPAISDLCQGGSRETYRLLREADAAKALIEP